MSYRGELPGFYWDEERSKYFAVTENHYAVSAAEVRYTKGSVEEEKKGRKKRKREEHRANVRRRTMIQRADSLVKPDLNRVGITSELGYRSSKDIIHERSEAYLREIGTKIIVRWPAMLGPFDLTRRRDRPGSPQEEIQSFTYDRETGTVIAAVNNETTSHNCVAYSIPSVSSRNSLVYDVEEQEVMLFEASSFSSIDLDSRRRTFTTTTLGDKAPPMVHIGKLLEPDKFQASFVPDIIDESAVIQFRPTNVSTIFTSAINPWGSNTAEHIAIGMSSENGFSILSAANDGHHFGVGWTNSGDMATNSDVLALDWLDPNIVAAGCRSGTVCLYDVRTRAGVKRMRHVSGILSLKRADVETRFVVAGMGGKMAMYDMRFLKETDAYMASRKANVLSDMEVIDNNSTLRGKQTGKSKPRYNIAMPVAKPYLTFEYDNDVQMLGMDVSSELGMVVTAERKGLLRAASLRSGKVIKEWRVGRPQDRVQCVKFVEDQRGVPKILACSGVEIAEFGLQGRKRWG